MAKKVGVIGSGVVGQVLAAGCKKHGWDVMIGARSKDKVAEWAAANGVEAGTFADTAAFGELLILAVGGAVAGDALDAAGHDSLAGKVIVDATNPIGGAPEGGILRFFTGPNDSLMERLQARVPAGRFVKAFSCVGNALMVNPQLAGGRPTMFICGDDAAAKADVTALLDQFGWDAEDVGGVQGARAIEPLCQLWCAPGFLRNDWMHAFKVLR